MKWISCSKKMPEQEEECLVAHEIWPGDHGCGYCYDLATFYDGKFLTWELKKTILNVTYWMKLPKSPNELGLNG